MFDKIRQSRLLFWSIEALVLVALVWGLSQINFIFAPLATFFSTLLIPILTAGFLFYLFDPLIRFLERLHVPRGLGILLVFLTVIGGVALIVAAIIPNLINQVTQMVTGLPTLVSTVRSLLHKAADYQWYKQFGVGTLLDNIKVQPSTILAKVLGNGFSNGIPTLLGSVAGFFISLITIPVLLFYMLKDGGKLVPSVQRLFPERYQDEIQIVFTKMNDTLSHYIAGQAIECLFVGTFTFIGYLLIGMPYALLLSFIAGVVTIIPYLGPYIGITPALLVALTMGWQQVALVVIVVIIVQQTDGNLIYPNVIGRSLDIHPMTIIVLLLVAGNLVGIMGTILAVPVYAIAKTLVAYGLELYRFHKNGPLALPEPEAPKSN